MKKVLEPNIATPFMQDGSVLSIDGRRVLASMAAAIRELQDAQAALSGVAKPAGGSNIDTEARAALDAIIDAAS